ncbi:hypothetical protein VBD025_06965 [Virgibacillus flavescens]|uniref:hypothetical protein n=1 Tax=Virgibacillus flavescens TaxID=1611422 RepID=UPI003D346B5B
MLNPTIIVRDKQESNQLEIKRMGVYKQSKVIEATDEQDQTYYLFFYKEQFLNYLIPEKTPTRSHVVDCFTKGITLDPPHPLIVSIVSPHPHFKKHEDADLFKKIQKQYSPQEAALIAKYFESFIKKDKIADFIETLFYKERRDGKLLSCYRILTLLKEIAPNHTVVTTFSGDMAFTKYADLYKNSDIKTLARDEIFVERKLYSSKHNEQPFQKLLAIYLEQNRWVDAITIYIDQVVHTQKVEDYQSLLSMVNDHFDGEERFYFLKDLYTRGLHIKQLHSDLLNASIENDKLEGILTLLNEQDLTLEPLQSQKLLDMVKQHGIASDSISPEGLQKLILTLSKSEDPQVEDTLNQTISLLMDNHNLTYIQEWAKPLRNEITEPTFAKIDEMVQITDDPNQQQRLGELYHEFHQPRLAIDCMSWDMELRENDPKPVQWLAKLYDELGMNDEHKAYQQLYIDMVKRS